MTNNSFLDTYRKITPSYLGANLFRYVRRYVLQEIKEKHGIRPISIIGDWPIARETEVANKIRDCIRASQPPEDSAEEKTCTLILNTPGGELDEAKKLVEVLRTASPKGFDVIVPSYAKSVGTFICLAANQILMGDTSELGPIDPQIWMGQPWGYVSALASRAELALIRAGSGDPNRASMLIERQKAVPLGALEKIDEVITDAVMTAERFIREYMYGGEQVCPDLRQVITKLNEGPHSRPIRYDEAKKLGLKVIHGINEGKADLLDDVQRYYEIVKATIPPNSIFIESVQHDFLWV